MSPAANDNVLPLVPNDVTGSPTSTPLVLPVEYQQVTNDYSTNVELVTDLIEEVVEDLSRECRRTFTYGQYTEAQYLYANGMVYPSATPIDVTKVISASVEGNSNIYDPASGDPFSSIIQGDGVWVGWFSPLPWMPYYTGVIPPQTILTYWGGFQNKSVADSPSLALPSKLKRMICKMVYYRANPVMLTGMPAGVKSMSVGGVSISGDLSSMLDTDPQLRRDIKRWRHPQAIPWQS